MSGLSGSAPTADDVDEAKSHFPTGVISSSLAASIGLRAYSRVEHSNWLRCIARSLLAPNVAPLSLIASVSCSSRAQ